MGKIEQGLFGGFLNKTGNLVGGSWKGISTVRIYQPNVSNPRTTAQVNQRNKMSGITAFASLILIGVIKPLWDRFASKMSGYNDFIRTNMPAVDTDGVIVPNNLVISKGKLDGVASFIALADVSSKNVLVTTTALPSTRYAAASDKVYAVVYDAQADVVCYAGDTGLTRTQVAGGASITNVENMTAGNDTYVYIAFVRADGTMVSDSQYQFVTPQA